MTYGIFASIFTLFFHDPSPSQNQLNLLISMTSISVKFSRFIANLFRFLYIMASRAPFFLPFSRILS